MTPPHRPAGAQSPGRRAANSATSKGQRSAQNDVPRSRRPATEEFAETSSGPVERRRNKNGDGPLFQNSFLRTSSASPPSPQTASA
jgi:hypothetical protein